MKLGDYIVSTNYNYIYLIHFRGYHITINERWNQRGLGYPSFSIIKYEIIT